MLMVISPAKNLDYKTEPQTKLSSKPSMLKDSQVLIDELKRLSPQEVSALMGISDKLGVLNYDRYQTFTTPFTKKNAKPAALAFNGDVYAGLDAPNMSDEELSFAQEHLRILSGLYGLLRPLDLMQPYRLEMGTKFSNPRGANLYEFWGDEITKAINKQLKALDSNTLINLASNEYFKSVDVGAVNARVMTPVFKDWKTDKYKIISFYAKKARGLMSAYIIKNKITHADDLKGFDYEGYGYNKALSEGDELVFTRKQ